MAPRPRNPSRPVRPRRPTRKLRQPRRASRSQPFESSQKSRPGDDLFSGPFSFARGHLFLGVFFTAATRALSSALIEIHAVVKVPHADALVFSMLAIVVLIKEHARNAVGRDAGDAHVLPVGGPGGHGRDERNAGPHVFQDFLHGLRYFRVAATAAPARPA